MANFKTAFPEMGVLPPSLPGVEQVPTKLHALRLRQLLDLAQAFGVELPPLRTKPNYTKAQILPYMIAAEEQGVFRQEPKSRYHLLHAQLDHDAKMHSPEQQRAQEILIEQLKKAEYEEFPLTKKAKYAEMAADPDTLFYWQQQAKQRGLKGTMGKSKEALQAMVEEYDNEVAGLAEAAASNDGTAPGT